MTYERSATCRSRRATSPGALEALRRGQAIMTGLAALSPDNAGWKRDLDWFASQIAELSQ